MEIVNFPNQSFNVVGATGDCPHCRARSLFNPVTTGYFEERLLRICNGAQCQSCKNFVLVVGRRNAQQTPFQLEACYPLGKPDDRVDAIVPPGIREDFGEALRCRWVEAYRAAVVMCRRAVQNSCVGLKADGARLIDQIDSLAAQGTITNALKEMAHEVRLTGNDGAHPDKDGLSEVTQGDADDIIEFTREYLHHVYVMPAKLQARRAKPAPAAAAAPPGTAK
jgi:Domain of unknown function (DUF4145)